PRECRTTALGSGREVVAGAQSGVGCSPGNPECARQARRSGHATRMRLPGISRPVLPPCGTLPWGSRMDWKALEGGVHAQVERGEHDSAATLVIQRLGPDLHEFFQGSVDEDEAADALSIWREAVWKDLRNFRWECSLRGWAYRVGKHSLNRIL